MNIYEQLRRDEGEEYEVYLDSLGIRTAGVGHNLVAHGILWEVGTPIERDLSDKWLREDVAYVIAQLRHALPWLPVDTEQWTPRHWVLVNMGFNMGAAGLLKFHRMLTFMETETYGMASIEITHSKAATQTGDRYVRLAKQMLTGEWQ